MCIYKVTPVCLSRGIAIRVFSTGLVKFDVNERTSEYCSEYVADVCSFIFHKK